MGDRPAYPYESLGEISETFVADLTEVIDLWRGRGVGAAPFGKAGHLKREEDQMIGNRAMKWLRFGAMIAAGVTTATLSASAETKKYQVYLSMSYVGNGWQSEATNMVSAMAKYYSDKMDFHIQVAGPVAQRKFSKSIRWSRPAPTPLSSTRSRRPR